MPLTRLYRNLADAARDIEDEIFKAEVQEAARRVEGMRVGLGEFLSPVARPTTSTGLSGMRSARRSLTLTARAYRCRAAIA